MLMTHNNPVIEVRNLVRRYGRTDAVDGLSLSVPAGRCYGFFGRNGAGKTTTIKCLLNLLRPTSGEVRVFGMDPARPTVFVSTHLISEFEGLIDEFTIIDRGREVLTLNADAARARHEKSLEEIFVTTLQPHGVTA